MIIIHLPLGYIPRSAATACRSELIPGVSRLHPRCSKTGRVHFVYLRSSPIAFPGLAAPILTTRCSAFLLDYRGDLKHVDLKYDYAILFTPVCVSVTTMSSTYHQHRLHTSNAAIQHRVLTNPFSAHTEEHTCKGIRTMYHVSLMAFSAINSYEQQIILDSSSSSSCIVIYVFIRSAAITIRNHLTPSHISSMS